MISQMIQVLADTLNYYIHYLHEVAILAYQLLYQLKKLHQSVKSLELMQPFYVFIVFATKKT
jgi:hypothetical protein